MPRRKLVSPRPAVRFDESFALNRRTTASASRSEAHARFDAVVRVWAVVTFGHDAQ